MTSTSHSTVDPDRMEVFNTERGKAEQLARRLARPEEVDDMVAAAVAALWESLLRWEPDRGPFWVFARPSVYGALLDEVRQRSLLLSRHDYAKRPLVAGAVAALQRRTGKTPTDAEVAEDVKLPLRQVRRIRSAARVCYLDEVDGGRSDIERYVEGAGVVDALPEMLTSLGLRDLYTVLRYTGLDDAPPESLRDIAAALGESHETTRSRLRRVLSATV